MNKFTVADYRSALDEGGPEHGFIKVYDAFAKKIESHIHYKLNCSCYKSWGRCIDPAGHKNDLTQDTFIDFSEFNKKFFTGEYKKELISLSGLLYRISDNNVWDHLNRRRCSDTPPDSTICLDDVDYLLPDAAGAGEFDGVIFFKQAVNSLPHQYREALQDFICGFCHEEISLRRGISVAVSKKRRWIAIHKFRRYYDK